jgi:hypothetical protein
MIAVINITEANAVRKHGNAWAVDFVSPSGRRSTEYVGGSVGKVEDNVFFVEPFVAASYKGFGSALRNCEVIGGEKIPAEMPEQQESFGSVANTSTIKKGFFTVEAEGVRHRTFRVKTSRNGKSAIGLMTGSNNLKDYTWFGYLNGSDIRFWTTPSVAFGVPATLPISNDEVRECWAAIVGDTDAAGLRFAREYQNCSRCGKVLTTPESLDRGIGPECAAVRYGASRRRS